MAIVQILRKGDSFNYFFSKNWELTYGQTTAYTLQQNTYRARLTTSPQPVAIKHFAKQMLWDVISLRFIRDSRSVITHYVALIINTSLFTFVFRRFGNMVHQFSNREIKTMWIITALLLHFLCYPLFLKQCQLASFLESSNLLSKI